MVVSTNTSGACVSESGYLLSNVNPQTGPRLRGLELSFDPVTVGHVERLGIGPGQRCLEIGAGAGSIACWLADRVGPSGRVLATDIDPQWMIAEGQPQLEIRRHDIEREAVPEGPWDLIHERLVLLHLPERLEVLDRLVAALAPGGWLLIEDFDDVAMPTIDRTGVHHDLIAKVRTVFTELLRQRGALADFGANALRHLKERGLVDTGASGHVVIDVGGSPFARVLAASAALLHDPLLASGITPDEYDRYLAALDDPDVIVRSPEMISAWGRRRPY